MKKAVYLALVASLVLSTVVGAAGCSKGLGKEVKLGIIIPVTGSQAKFGEAQKRGYAIALEEINKAGGVLGKPLALVYEDDMSKAEGAISAVDKLVTQQKLTFILGSYSSATTEAAASKISGYAVPLLIPTAAADSITEKGSQWVFRINAPSKVYASVVLDFMNKVAAPKTLAIIYENTNFGTSTAKASKEQAEAMKIKVVSYEAYQAGAPDFKPLLLKVKKENPEVVFFVSYLLDATLLMRQTREIDFNPKLYTAGGAGFSMLEFVAASGAGKDAEFTTSVTQWTPDVKWKGAKEFAEKFKGLYGTYPEYHSAEAYAALNVAKDVIERAKSLDPKKLREALAATDIKDGPFGPIKFDAKGQNTHTMLVTQIQGGQFVTVYPESLAGAKTIYPTPAWKERK